MADPSIYTISGTVQAGEGIYLPRPADDELLQHCLAGDFCYVLTARQMGKSSLMVRTAEQLNAQGVRSVRLDLTQLGTNLEADQWYLGLIYLISEQLDLAVDTQAWWNAHAHWGPTMRLSQFLRHELLEQVPERVVIFVDEIDTTLSLDFSDDFFAAIRACYNDRSHDPAFRRLSFVLLGVATPGDLIRDPKRTPFNIGQPIDLTNFTFEQARPLADGLGLPPAEAQRILAQVLDWTGGHPYLTQHLCRELAARLQAQPAGRINRSQVLEVVATNFLGDHNQQDHNLQFVRDMLTRRAPDIRQVLNTYRAVYQGKTIRDDPQDIIKAHLKISGAVRSQNNRLVISNRIYQQVFDHSWIKAHLPLVERRRLVLVLGTTTVLAVLLAVLGITGWLNQFIYRPLDTTWVEIPAGEFLMGAEAQQGYQACVAERGEENCLLDWFLDEEPVHPIDLDTYQIEAYEVTNQQYAQCVKNGACQGGGYTFEDEAGNIINRLNDAVYDDHPVVSVDWFQATTYCEWIGGRLPTEAEWEKAARGGREGKLYPWGDQAPDCALTNFYNYNVGESCVGETSPVGNYAPNGYDLYDMAGNVWEWTADWYDVYPDGEPDASDYFGEQVRVLRGGGWYSNGYFLRAADRVDSVPSHSSDGLGFRCARSP